MAVKRMDNVGIVVEDIDAAIEFFTELGLALEGRMPIEGEWAGRVTGVRGQRVEIAMMRTPDGHSRLEPGLGQHGILCIQHGWEHGLHRPIPRPLKQRGVRYAPLRPDLWAISDPALPLTWAMRIVLSL